MGKCANVQKLGRNCLLNRVDEVMGKCADVQMCKCKGGAVC
jgi:hypothetical protein